MNVLLDIRQTLAPAPGDRHGPLMPLLADGAHAHDHGTRGRSRIAGNAASRPGRRLVGIAAMLVGSALGGFLVLRAGIIAAPASALVLLAVVAACANMMSRAHGAWTSPGT